MSIRYEIIKTENSIQVWKDAIQVVCVRDNEDLAALAGEFFKVLADINQFEIVLREGHETCSESAPEANKADV